MSFFKSIKSAFGGSEDEYDVFGQTTSFVNPFSKDAKPADRERVQDDVKIEVDKNAEYAIDAEFADKAGFKAPARQDPHLDSHSETGGLTMGGFGLARFVPSGHQQVPDIISAAHRPGGEGIRKNRGRRRQEGRRTSEGLRGSLS